MKLWKNAAALLCAVSLMLSAIPAVWADEHVDEVLYQPNPLCGTYLGKNSSSLFEFEVTIPADRENQPHPLVSGPYYITSEISNVAPEGSGELVISTRAQYFYGVAPGTADITYNTYLDGESPQPRAVVHVTVVSQADYDALMDSESTPHPDGHTHRWHYSWTRPTCQQEGRRTRTCNDCKTTETLATCGTVDHAYRVLITKKPTAAQEGVRTYTCNVCRYSFTEAIPSLGGGSSTTDPSGGNSATDPSGSSTTVPGGGNATTNPGGGNSATDPSGSSTTVPGGGSTTTNPSGGSNTTQPEGDMIDAFGRSYKRVPGGTYYIQQLTKSTFGGADIKEYNCPGKTSKHNIEYHTKAPTCTEGDSTYYYCTLCGEKQILLDYPALGHDYKSEVTEQPRVGHPGTTTYTCTRCGDVYTQAIPALEAVQGTSGMAASDRGNPLHLLDDGNYELFWVDGLLIRDGSTGEPKEDHRKLKITTYSPEFKELSVKELPIELPQIGGVHFGKDCNFIVFGQNNFEESRTKEVLRVVKYSKNWRRLGAASLSDANTIGVIEQHGNLSFAEGGGMLYIHCGHAMFTWTDGLNHQANMTFSIRVSDMTITDKRCSINTNASGYVSHSLAQDVIVDGDGKIVTLDTGDGSPNGALLYRYAARAGEEKFNTGAGEQNRFVTWPGPRQDIRTGGMTCALAETSKGYLSAYVDTKKGAAFDYYNDPWSLYLAFTPKDSFSADATQIRTVVQLPAGAQEMVSHAWLIPTSPEGGYLMWYSIAKTEKGFYGDYTLYYTTYSADGTTGTHRKLSGVPMPYNGPILNGDKLVWTGSTEDMMGLLCCTLDPDSGRTETTYASGELQRIKLFSDVQDVHWFKPYVDKVVAAELMTGVSEDRFDPDNSLTVAEALVLAYSTRHFYFNADGETLPVNSSGPWYIPYYQWCLNKKIIDARKFPASSLDRPCTRYEMLEILDAAYCEPDFQQVKTVNSIPDVPAGGARSEIVYRWYRGGKVTGSSDGLFHGDSNITRAEVTVILCQLEGL